MDLPDDHKYADVTNEFFSAVEKMDKGKVEVISRFDMLEGARALEMGNTRLDTGLLKLTPEELTFDSSSGQSLSAVVSIMNKLLVLYTTWLNGHSLSVTILSSRHMLDFLQSFQKHGSLKKAGFVNSRLHSEDYMPDNSLESHLVNIVLRAFVIGLSKLIGFSLSVATSVLYDEEDLVTRSMGMDFLGQISPQIVCAEIEDAEKWLQSQSELESDESFATATSQLKLIKALVRLEFLMIQDIQLFGTNTPQEISEKSDILSIAGTLKSHQFGDFPGPAFSRFVQLDCDNKHLPSKNVEITQVQAYSELEKLIVAIDDMVHNFSAIMNVSQLQYYLKYHVGFKLATTANALWRGIFQLFFIRDDRSIVGSNESVGSITTRLLDSVSLCGNSIMDPNQWTIQNSKSPESTKADCLNKLAELLNDLEAATLHKVGAYGNNRCRQRQINNKSIILWDSLHFNAEAIESELFGFGIGDKLSPSFPDHPAFGISAYVFLEKLDVMVDLALSGFEEDLYKTHEAPMMYWYVSELCLESYHLVTERLVKINQGKLLSIQNIPKKIKATKAGPKKEALKAEYNNLKEHVVPALADNITYLEKYLAPSQLALSHATKGIAIAISLLIAVCEYKHGSSNLVSYEKLYNLRMKPWSSIGVPEMPKFQDYVQSHQATLGLRDLSGEAKRSKILELIHPTKLYLDTAINSCEELCSNLENDEVLKERTWVGEECEAKVWFNDLKKTCEGYRAQIVQINTKGGENYDIKKAKGSLPYFPLFSVIP